MRGAGTPLAAYEEGQGRLREAITRACEPAAGLPAKVESALGAALSLLAADPDLAHLLAAPPDRADTEAWRRRWEWQRRYGELLRDAAVRDGATVPPFFVEPTLIGGLAFLVARQVEKGEVGGLERLAPTARWYLLSYYLSPVELARHTSDRPATGEIATLAPAWRAVARRRPTCADEPRRGAR